MKNIQFDRVFVRNAVYVVLSVLALTCCGIFVYKKTHPVIRFVSKFSEMWYPRDKAVLHQKMSNLFDRAQVEFSSELTTRPWLLFVPHAGYDYSGVIAAAGYQALLGALGKSVKRIILLSPSHYIDFTGMCVPSFTHYQTPLGDVTVDTNAVMCLRREQGISVAADDLVFHREHAIDVQIPWIQTCMPNAEIVPIVVGRLPAPEMVHDFAAALVRVVDASTVVVVSTDLVHYGKRFNFMPFAKRASMIQDVQGLELSVLNAMATLDRQFFEDTVAEAGATVCGKNVIRIALEIAQQGWVSAGSKMVSLREQSHVKILAHDTSASIRHLSFDDPQDYETVGYGAVAAFISE